MSRKLGCLTLGVAIGIARAAVAMAATAITTQSITPSVLTFSATDPDNITVPANSTATVTFSTLGGNANKSWSLQLQATAAIFGTCPSPVPVSRVTVICASATASGGATGGCAPPSALSTTLQTIASGNEAKGTADYLVTLNFIFNDSWGTIAVPPGAPCTIGLTYLITAQ